MAPVLGFTLNERKPSECCTRSRRFEPSLTLTYTLYRYGSDNPFQRCGLLTVVFCTKFTFAPAATVWFPISSATTLPAASTTLLMTVSALAMVPSLRRFVVIARFALAAVTFVGLRYTPGVCSQ